MQIYNYMQKDLLGHAGRGGGALQNNLFFFPVTVE